MFRPQEPKRPFPYIESEVTFTNAIDGTVLKGTLTLPDENSKYAAVILVSGSGAQNRDEEILGHKPFLVIADYLTKAGIAVLRYDDRHLKMPTKKGWKFTTLDLAGDTKAALEFLSGHANVNAAFIGIAGHSEGGLIASIVASTDPRVAFIISLAGPGVSGKHILAKQAEHLSRKPKDIVFAKKSHGILVSEPDIKFRKKKIWQAFNSVYGYFNVLGRVKQWLTIDMTVSEWMRFFINYDPAEAWQKVKCPVLALCGEYDIQVLPAENLSAIGHCLKLAENGEYVTHIIPKANHLFQIVESGGPKTLPELLKEYQQTEQTFSPDVLETMKDWILKRHSQTTNKVPIEKKLGAGE